VFTKIRATCLLLAALTLSGAVEARQRRPAPIEYASLGPAPQAAPAGEDLGPGAARTLQPEDAELPFGAPLEAGAAEPQPDPLPPAAAFTAPPAPIVVGSGPYYVQLAAFGDFQNAERLRLRLNRPDAQITTGQTASGIMHRVRLGGFATREQAELTRDRLEDDGFSGALIIAGR
jgi:cell division septation protein DedD